MDKPIYLGLSILEISKILIYELWYDYIEPKYQNNAKLCYTDADSFIINIKTENFYNDIADDVEKRVTHVLRPMTYSYLIVDGNTDKKAKVTKKRVIIRILKFNDYKNCILDNKIILKSQQRFKSEAHNVYTEIINKIALSNNDDKRLQTFDRITSYPYGSSKYGLCKTEIINKYK